WLYGDPTTPKLYSLSLHDALPICGRADQEDARRDVHRKAPEREAREHDARDLRARRRHPRQRVQPRVPEILAWARGRRHRESGRSEEHTSELQSLRHLVCRLLLEK